MSIFLTFPRDAMGLISGFNLFANNSTVVLITSCVLQKAATFVAHLLVYTAASLSFLSMISFFLHRMVPFVQILKILILPDQKFSF